MVEPGLHILSKLRRKKNLEGLLRLVKGLQTLIAQTNELCSLLKPAGGMRDRAKRTFTRTLQCAGLRLVLPTQAKAHALARPLHEG